MASCTDPAENFSVAPVMASGAALPLSRIAFAHSSRMASVSRSLPSSPSEAIFTSVSAPFFADAVTVTTLKAFSALARYTP